MKDLRREEEEKRHEELRVASCELRGPPPQGSHSQPATRNPQPLHSSLSFFTTYIPYQISAAPQITNSTASVSAALLCVASIVITRSRGGLVGLIAVLSTIWLMSPRKVVSLVLVAVLAAGVYAVADQKYWDRPLHLTTKVPCISGGCTSHWK